MPRQQKPLLDRLMNTSAGKVAHSTGYGVAQNPGRIGTASTQSFGERRAIDRQRNFVGRYKDARVMRESRNTLPQARAYGGAELDVADGTGGADGAGVRTGSASARAGARPGAGGKAQGQQLDSAAARAQMAARFEPAKPMSGGPTPPPRRNAGI